MSYEIVKGITIKDNKVFMNTASNNVRPLYFNNTEFPYFTKILQEKGKQELDIALLKEYESGNLQQGNNKYTRALKVLYFLLREEYNKFDWRNHNAKYGSEEEKQERALRDSEEFKALLLKALNTSLPKEKYIISKNYGGRIFFVRKETKNRVFYGEREQAKVYNLKGEAERIAKIIPNAEVILMEEQ